VDNFTLATWRSLDAALVLEVVSDYAKRDIDYTPRRNIRSTRWQVTAGGQDYEILCTGPKFLDTRAKLGGGGAVDLVMHLFRLDFKHAVSLLREKNL
jgi:hypothetical protein